MRRATKRWVAIALCVGLPGTLLVLGRHTSIDTPVVDPTFPARCDSVLIRVDTADAADATAASDALLAAADATDEERRCGAAAKQALKPALPSPATNVSDEPCELAAAMHDTGADAAAAAVYEFVAAAPAVADRACPPPGPAALPPRVPAFPACAAVGRLLASGPIDAARTGATALVGQPDTSTPDAVCISLALRAAETFDEPPLDLNASTASVRAALVKGLDSSCVAAAQLAQQGDVEAARDAYDKVLADSTEAADARLCAAGGLARLPTRLSPGDWIFQRADAGVQRVSSWVLPDTLGLPDGSQTTVIAICLLATIGLLVVALRQFIRWRRERLPGPVEIAVTASSVTDLKSTQQLIEGRLASAGVLPNALAPSVGGVVVDVVSVLDIGGDAGLLGKVVQAIRDALTVTVGYRLSVTFDRDAATSSCAALVRLDDAASGRPVKVARIEAATERDATIEAAYWTYLQLSAIDEVRRRTPKYLRWATDTGLRDFQAGKAAEAADDYDTAIDRYRQAAAREVGNLSVQLGLANATNMLADARCGLGDTPAAGDSYLESLLAALRAARLNTYSMDAHQAVALIAQKVDRWLGRWDMFAERDEVLRLLGWDTTIATPVTHDTLQTKFRSEENVRWRRARRQTWWPWVVWAGWRLERRRSVAGMLSPWSRLRHSVHDQLLGNVVSGHYQELERGDSRPLAKQRAWVGLHVTRLGRLRGLRRPTAKEDIVYYNLAIAYVYRAKWLSNPTLPGNPTKARANAQKWLERSFVGGDAALTASDLEYTVADGDLADLRGVRSYEVWWARYRSGDADTVAIDRAKKDWSDRFSAAAAQAELAALWWSEQLGAAAPATSLWLPSTAEWASKAVQWLGDDLDRWTKATASFAAPRSASASDAFAKAVGKPALNAGRPPRQRTGRSSFDGNTPTLVETSALTYWKPVRELAAKQVDVAREQLDAALRLADTHGLVDLRTVVLCAADTSRQAWLDLATLCEEPSPQATTVAGSDHNNKKFWMT